MRTLLLLFALAAGLPGQITYHGKGWPDEFRVELVGKGQPFPGGEVRFQASPFMWPLWSVYVIGYGRWLEWTLGHGGVCPTFYVPPFVQLEAPQHPFAWFKIKVPNRRELVGRSITLQWVGFQSMTPQSCMDILTSNAARVRVHL